MSITGALTPVGLDSPAEVLGFARACRREADLAQARLLVAAVTWAEQHPPESIGLEATWRAGGGTETAIPLAGEGAPLVAEFCLAELAAALGVSTDSGRNLVAAAVELKYRLPRVWARVQDGALPAWRARRVAETTLVLTAEAASFVDAQVAGFAHRISFAALERLVATAIARFMPEKTLAQARDAADRRHVTFHHDQVSLTGTTFVEGELDLADALDLDAALSRGAHELKALGSSESLDVRRSIAAGDLARRQLALDLNSPDLNSGQDLETTEGPSLRVGRRPVKPRQVVLYVHLTQTAITGSGAGTGERTGGSGCLELARVENHRRGVIVDQVRSWCADTQTTVSVKPVIDLNEHLHVEAYEVTDRLREHSVLVNHHCVFPHCTRPARGCDIDHVIAHDRGGTTSSGNLAPHCADDITD